MRRTYTDDPAIAFARAQQQLLEPLKFAKLIHDTDKDIGRDYGKLLAHQIVQDIQASPTASEVPALARCLASLVCIEEMRTASDQLHSGSSLGDILASLKRARTRSKHPGLLRPLDTLIQQLSEQATTSPIGNHPMAKIVFRFMHEHPRTIVQVITAMSSHAAALHAFFRDKPENDMLRTTVGGRSRGNELSLSENSLILDLRGIAKTIGEAAAANNLWSNRQVRDRVWLLCSTSLREDIEDLNSCLNSMVEPLCESSQTVCAPNIPDGRAVSEGITTRHFTLCCNDQMFDNEPDLIRALSLTRIFHVVNRSSIRADIIAMEDRIAFVVLMQHMTSDAMTTIYRLLSDHELVWVVGARSAITPERIAKLALMDKHRIRVAIADDVSHCCELILTACSLSSVDNREQFESLVLADPPTETEQFMCALMQAPFAAHALNVAFSQLESCKFGKFLTYAPQAIDAINDERVDNQAKFLLQAAQLLERKMSRTIQKALELRTAAPVLTDAADTVDFPVAAAYEPNSSLATSDATLNDVQFLRPPNKRSMHLLGLSEDQSEDYLRNKIKKYPRTHGFSPSKSVLKINRHTEVSVPYRAKKGRLHQTRLVWQRGQIMKAVDA